MGQKWTLESAKAEKAPGLHPLAGARLSTFLGRALTTPGFSARSRYQRLIAWVAQMARFPLSTLEKIKYAKAISEVKMEKPPIFLIGHWRSGTTHLHNLLSRDPQFGYLKFSETAMPFDMLGKKVEIARKFIDKALPETRGYDNVKLTLDEPQEEEMALGNLNSIGYYNIYYFPQQMDEHQQRALFFNGVTKKDKAKFQKNYEFLVRKLSFVKGGKQVLLKNPPSTTRMRMIKEMFPNAKFIHIVRNPWPVFSSTVGKFPRLYNAFAWQDFQNVDLSRYTLRTYEELMRRYINDRDQMNLPSDELFETSYEKITADPLGEIERIYDQLGLEAKDDALREIGGYVANIKDYNKNTHRISPEDAEQIRSQWKFSFDEWGYPLDPPDDIVIE